MMSLLPVLYSVLVFTVCIPLLVIGICLLCWPALAVAAFRSVLIEAYKSEREKKDDIQVHLLSQPAYKMYAFGGGWYITLHFSNHLLVHSHDLVDTLMHYAATTQYMACTSFWFIRWFVVYVAWLVIIGLQIAARLQYILVVACIILFFILHTLLLGLWLTSVLICLGLLSSIKALYARMYDIAIRCPACYKEMRTSIYRCPTCGTEHTLLYPSTYGLWFHRCKVCRRNLPTLDMLGRRGLSRLCAYCHHPLPACIGTGATVHIALCGGLATGKTSYIITAMSELKDMLAKSHFGQNQYSMTSIDPAQGLDLEPNMRSIAYGEALTLSDKIIPRASIWQIEPSNRGKRKYIHIYDPAGKAFVTRENVSSQQYYQYVDGLIFTIDPLALAASQQEFSSEDKQVHQTKRISGLDTVQSYERMMDALEIFMPIRQRRRYNLPLAVVLTRVDTPALEHEFGTSAAQLLMKRDRRITSESDAVHQLVRKFLCSHGLDNVVSDIETHFSHVRYFSCAALSHEPGVVDGSKFIPIRVLDPLLWLLTQNGILPK